MTRDRDTKQSLAEERRRRVAGVSGAQTSADNAQNRADSAHTRLNGLSFSDVSGTINSTADISADSVHGDNKLIQGSVSRIALNNSDVRNWLDGFYSQLGHGHFIGSLAGQIADSQIPDDRITARMVDNEAIRGRGVGGSNHILLASIGLGDMDSALNGGSQGSYRFRKISGTGNSGAAAASNHTHSLEYKTMTRNIRRGMLGLRERIRGIDPENVTPKNFQDIKDGFEFLMHLAMDEENHDAFEREELLVKDSRFRKKFLRENKHEYDGQMMLRHKSGFYLEPHPRLAHLLGRD